MSMRKKTGATQAKRASSASKSRSSAGKKSARTSRGGKTSRKPGPSDLKKLLDDLATNASLRRSVAKDRKVLLARVKESGITISQEMEDALLALDFEALRRFALTFGYPGTLAN
jgi:hypothetical protein